MLFRTLLSAGVAATLVTALPAVAADRPIDQEARLVERNGTTFVRFSGRGAAAATRVTVEGRPVAVEGRRRWRADLPLASLKSWAVPYARTVSVTAETADGSTTRDARLPVGLLGQPAELASLEITAH